jgi:hypothetical protein
VISPELDFIHDLVQIWPKITTIAIQPGSTSMNAVLDHSPVSTAGADLKTSQAALRVFFRISRAWDLTPTQEQIVLGTSRTTLFNWRSGAVRAALEPVVLERLSYVFRIYAALEILLPKPERATRWVKAANTAAVFGGASALDRMLAGQVGDLKVVADYLDAQRGGDFS